MDFPDVRAVSSFRAAPNEFRAAYAAAGSRNGPRRRDRFPRSAIPTTGFLGVDGRKARCVMR
jgi:hypothetical protein